MTTKLNTELRSVDRQGFALSFLKDRQDDCRIHYDDLLALALDTARLDLQYLSELKDCMYLCSDYNMLDTLLRSNKSLSNCIGCDIISQMDSVDIRLINLLSALLANFDQEVVASACNAIVAHEAAARCCLHELILLLDRSDSIARIAAMGLMRLGPIAKCARAALLNRLHSATDEILIYTINRALVSIGDN